MTTNKDIANALTANGRVRALFDREVEAAVVAERRRCMGLCAEAVALGPKHYLGAARVRAWISSGQAALIDGNWNPIEEFHHLLPAEPEKK